MSDLTSGLTAAELYMACTMRKETRGMGYPERLDASTLTQEDIDTYRRAYGDQHAAQTKTGPAACWTPQCLRPGLNGAGYCCHGCAAHSRFGHNLLHSIRCEEANPGRESAPGG